MALLTKVTLDSGLSVNGAYVRIDTVSGYKKEITISVNTYVSRDIYKDGRTYLSQKMYSFVPSVAIGSENFIKQGYNYLKTLSEFENAMNVPENGAPD